MGNSNNHSTNVQSTPTSTTTTTKLNTSHQSTAAALAAAAVANGNLILNHHNYPSLSSTTSSPRLLHNNQSTKRKTKSKDNLLNTSTENSITLNNNLFDSSSSQSNNQNVLDLLLQQQRLTSTTFIPNKLNSTNGGAIAILAATPTSPLIDRKKCSSRDNLLSSSFNTDLLYIALYDYKVNLDKHLILNKGDQLIVLSYNKTKEWCEVRNIQTNQVGWVPSSYIKHFNSLENYPWYHGKIERVKAEYLLSSGINGSFLVRESETCQNQLSISLRWEGRVYHYRINKEDNMYFVSKDSKFKSLVELVHHHSQEPDGLTTTLLYPAPKKWNKPQLYTFSPADVLNDGGDKWELDRCEIQMRTKLGL
jgi:hypothetical protein